MALSPQNPRLNKAELNPDTDLIEIFDASAGQVKNITPSALLSPPAGTAGQIQFSDGSAFAADSNLFWDNTNKVLNVGYGNDGKITLKGSAQVAEFTGGRQVRLGSGGGNPIFIEPSGGSGVGINFASPNPSAMLHIKGSGSTSATTSLLVQNSSANTILQMLDDGSCTIGRNGGTTLPLTIVGNTGVQAIIGNSSFQSPSNIARYGGGTLTFYASNNDGSAFYYSFNNSQQSDTTTSSMIAIGGTWQNQNAFQFANLKFQPTYDFSANTQSTAIARGIYYNPTITNLRVAQHRAIETTSGDVLLGTTSGKVVSGYLAAMGSPINDSLAIHLGGSQVFQVGNPLFTDQFMVIDSVAGSKRGIKFGNQGSTRQGIFLNNNDLQIAECNTTNYNPWLTIDYLSGGNVTIGAGATTSIGARLGIKGSGSTSATTSLLVQNSSASQLLKITDDGIVKVGDNTGNVGVIDVPHDAAYGYRTFLRIGATGQALLQTISNSGLRISASVWESVTALQMKSTNIGVYGTTPSGASNSSLRFIGNTNAYNSTGPNDALTSFNFEGNSTLQAGGSHNYFKVTGTINEAGGGGPKTLTGFYYNPTITGGTLLNDSHYCWYATSGQMMVNTTTPNVSAQLQVDSTNRGFLPPRMTTAQKLAIPTPSAGLMVYDTSLNQMSYYNGSAWVNF